MSISILTKFQNPKKRHLSNPKSGGDDGPEGSMVSLIENAFLIAFLLFMKLLQSHVTNVTFVTNVTNVTRTLLNQFHKLKFLKLDFELI